METSLLDKDRKYIWHPFTQEKTAPAPIAVARGNGSYLYTEDGRKILDGISSWWVTLHGHCHPRIAAAVAEQVGVLEQVIFAGATHRPAVLLGERILNLLEMAPGKVFYSDNGSTAVEVALKMALQYWANQGVRKRKIVAFRHSYHGDTFGAMSVGDRSPFTEPFKDKLFDVLFIDPPLRNSGAEESLFQLRGLIKDHPDIAAIIYEPMVQGAGGMLMQDPGRLEDCLELARSSGILCIADEVMTGFGRTGKMFASFWAKTRPDIVCIAKGLTGGTLPLSATVCHEGIYQQFCSEDPFHAFYHGHSFTANPVACAAAHASLNLLEEPESARSRDGIEMAHRNFRESLAKSRVRDFFAEVRQQGTILALEIKTRHERGYFNPLRRRILSYFVEQNVLLRPLGNVIYLIPPYSSTAEDLQIAYEAIVGFAEEMGVGL